MYSSCTTKIYMENMCGSARNSVVEKLTFLGSKGPPLGVIFSTFSIFYNFVFFCVFLWWGPLVDSEYIVFLENFDKKIFFDPRVPPWGVNFSMVKFFPNFVFFVMRTPYKLRIYSLFAKFGQKIFSTSEGPRVPPWGVNFSIVEIFSNFVFFLMRTP